VGAVIVRGSQVVGEGHTLPPGSDHAEKVAIKRAGEGCLGAVMYVSLEPCCHFGRTPPCTRAIVDAGIAEVHMAMLDPNPLVAGRGAEELRAAGIRTYIGEREEEARELNEAYAKFITTGLPFVTAKFATSLDGKIASRSGDSRWISGEQSRRYVHRLRRTADAVMVGVNTVLRDDPQLTARVGGGEGQGARKQPLRVIVDSHLRTPPGAKVLQMPGSTLLATTENSEEVKASRLAAAGAEVLHLAPRDSLVDLGELLRELGRREVTSVLVEGGATLLGSLFDLGLVDKVVAFVAPLIIGGGKAPTAVAGEGAGSMAEALRLSGVKVRRFGADVMVSGYVRESRTRRCSPGS